ncbi:glycoprotein 3-alpha-L-fucosyltransferase A [Eupeodes corollae]|uniref:glycoprotein 3-alpha-L-fucosyltransferase A n=1 Tax=Eupeodes corollae TaxID=290404 RepID=UPI0024919673|nr:glycoprotein 3-alpha-L-fucosyltransferase A [Eupeodes corollae]XP_055905669.1 glycoprotein 3-alpha-L-fucosyltransferase A [Eupeodes corollae]XP_055905670.1 glycoprotein 3-alpha-L-fucosyltransferase A [Eupeodes corollae]
MRRLKISLKKYFFLTSFFALLLIFGFNFKDREVWKPKASSSAQIYQLDTTEAENEGHHHAAAAGVGGGTPDLENSIFEATETVQSSFANSNQQNYESEQQVDQQKLSGSDRTSKAWFFKNGDRYPMPWQQTKGKWKVPRLLPHADKHSDRIMNQLMFVPQNYEQIQESGQMKQILLYNGLGPWNIKNGRDVFFKSKCPVDTCEITANRDKASTADLVLYKDHYIPTGVRRPPKQVHMLYYLECPYHTQNVKVPDAVNWTSTYRRDSDIVAPYEKWQYYNMNIRQIEQDRNYALNKTKKVAWFVSNCGARNGRLQFAHELQKYIDVDIYGACGSFKCSRSTADRCFDILDHDYKFYLAFENSNCKDYITEKFFVNALNRNILPIVMGARPEDYEVSSPHRSYIHVDEFASPKELAEYLNILDKDDELYNSYFKWKGTGEFINTYFWCRVCATLHDEEGLKKPRWYPDINDWWRGAGVCTNGSWRNFKARKDIITDD